MSFTKSVYLPVHQFCLLQKYWSFEVSWVDGEHEEIFVNQTKRRIDCDKDFFIFEMTHCLYRCCFSLYCHIFCRFQSLLPKNSLFCLKIISFSLSLLDCCKINNGLRIWPHNDKCFTIIQSVVDVIKLVLEELYIFPKLRNWIK